MTQKEDTQLLDRVIAKAIANIAKPEAQGPNEVWRVQRLLQARAQSMSAAIQHANDTILMKKKGI
jgi:hypothetical protein